MTRVVVRTTALVALVLIAGCSNKPATVSGKVTLAGKGPLTGGNITFTPTAAPDKARTVSIQGDGTYKALDLPRGECKVSIETASLKGLGGGAAATESMAGMGGGGATKYVPIDAKFAKPETSGLTVNIDKEEVTFDTEVTPAK